MFDKNDSKLRFLPLDDAATQYSGICYVNRDYWVAVCPERGIVFYQGNSKRNLTGASIQGNQDEKTARHVCGNLYPWAEIKQIPLIVYPVDVSDYN